MKTEDIILDITTDISNSLSDNALMSTIKKHSTRYGAENFLFGSALYHDLKPYPDIYILTGYSNKWQKRYHDKNYFDQDLTVAHCKEKTTPIIWPTQNKEIRQIDKQIFSEAADFGLRSGISFPFHTTTGEYGALAVSSSEDYQKSELSNPENLFSLQILGSTLFDLVRLKGKKENTITLTEREKECLKWVATGKTSWEISKILGLSERTVVFHIKNAASKMDTTSRTNASIIAILNGEIII